MTPDDCKGGDQLKRDADGNVLRTPDGQLLIQRKCIGTINAVVSGIVGICDAWNGAYVLPQLLDNCYWRTDYDGGSVPQFGTNMWIRLETMAQGWRMELGDAFFNPIFSSWRNIATGGECPDTHWPDGFCALGIWHLQGVQGACRCWLHEGNYATVTTELAA